MKITAPAFFEGFLIKERSFTFLLSVLLVYLFIIIPILGNTTLSKIAFIIFYYLLLSSSIPFLRQNKMSVLILILILGPFIFLVLEIIFSAAWLPLLTDILLIVYCLILAVIILWRTFQPGRISSRRVQGAIITYLLIGLIFGLIFHVIHLVNTTPCFTGLASGHRKEFIYYSLCAMTTNGYGDILPISPTVRSLSNLEALVGQLYPAVLIARLISMEFFYKKLDTQTDIKKEPV